MKKVLPNSDSDSTEIISTKIKRATKINNNNGLNFHSFLGKDLFPRQLTGFFMRFQGKRRGDGGYFF